MNEEIKQKTPRSISKYEFYFETALYDEVPLEELEEKFDEGDVDAYSALNNTETTYHISRKDILTQSKYDVNGRYIATIGYYMITLTCKRKEYDILRFFIYKTVDAIYKVGQNPSLADLQFAEIDKKYNKVLPAEDLKNLKKAIGLVSHAAGAGSFVYLRRIFEKLISESFKDNSKNLNISESDFQKLRMLDKVEILKDYLPSQLVEMKSVYSILGKGVHELTEQVCLKYFAPIKLSIELILDQKIEEQQKKEKDKRVKLQLAEIHQEIAKNKKESEQE